MVGDWLSDCLIVLLFSASCCYLIICIKWFLDRFAWCLRGGDGLIVAYYSWYLV